MRSLVVMLVGACSYTPPAEPSESSPDAPPEFDPRACPAAFETIGALTSRYYIADVWAAGGVGRSWEAAAEECAAAGEGGPATHLVVFESPEERAAVWATFGPRTSFEWIWTGTFEDTDGFTTIFGESIDEPAWAPGEPRTDRAGAPGAAIAHGTPDDEESDGDLWIPRNYGLDFACECDGRVATEAP